MMRLVLVACAVAAAVSGARADREECLQCGSMMNRVVGGTTDDDVLCGIGGDPCLEIMHKVKWAIIRKAKVGDPNLNCLAHDRQDRAVKDEGMCPGVARCALMDDPLCPLSRDYVSDLSYARGRGKVPREGTHIKKWSRKECRGCESIVNRLVNGITDEDALCGGNSGCYALLHPIEAALRLRPELASRHFQCGGKDCTGAQRCAMLPGPAHGMCSPGKADGDDAGLGEAPEPAGALPCITCVALLGPHLEGKNGAPPLEGERAVHECARLNTPKNEGEAVNSKNIKVCLEVAASVRRATRSGAAPSLLDPALPCSTDKEAGVCPLHARCHMIYHHNGQPLCPAPGAKYDLRTAAAAVAHYKGAMAQKW